MSNDSPAISTTTFNQTSSANPASTSGVAVLGAWILAIGLHVLALWLTYLYVLPFNPNSDADAAPVNIVLIGDPDGSGTGTSPIPLPGPQRGSPNFQDVQTANTLENIPLPGAMPPLEMPLQGIGTGSEVGDPGGSSGPSIVAGPGGTGVPIIGIGGGGEGEGEGSGFGSGKGGFFGIPATVPGEGGSVRGARRIVFVVDRSGSMADTFQAVREELRRSISLLKQNQRFHVIFFSQGAPIENTPKKLVPAISAAKQEFFEFLSGIEPTGGTHPELAMQRALSFEPELVFFLTDGQFDAALLPKLREWNKDSKIKISTIAYVSEEGRPLLEQIAREHNGQFRFVSEDQLP